MSHSISFQKGINFANGHDSSVGHFWSVRKKMPVRRNLWRRSGVPPHTHTYTHFEKESILRTGIFHQSGMLGPLERKCPLEEIYGGRGPSTHTHIHTHAHTHTHTHAHTRAHTHTHAHTYTHHVPTHQNKCRHQFWDTEKINKAGDGQKTS